MPRTLTESTPNPGAKSTVCSRAPWLRRWASAPVLLLTVMAALSFASVFAFARPGIDRIEPYLPGDIPRGDPLGAVLLGVGLGALARGLARGKRISWWLAVAWLALALVVQASTLEHPVGLAVVGFMLGVLVADRRRYYVDTGAASRRQVATLLVVAGLALAAETALVLAVAGGWSRVLAALAGVPASLGNALGMSDDLVRSVLQPPSPGGLPAILLVAARLPIVLASICVLAAIPEPPTDRHARGAADEIAHRFGRGALLPFILGRDKLVFSRPEIDGLVVYGVAGRRAVILGDVIGPPEAAQPTLEAFLERCRRFDRIPSVYQASNQARATLFQAGFHLFRVGYEAVVDLPTFDLGGTRRANLRHTVTRARRDGVTMRWYPRGSVELEHGPLLGELAAIDAAWRAGAGPELGFTLSSFQPGGLGGATMAVAIAADGKALAFATFRSTGTDGGWVLDLMRRSPSGPPGLVEACLAEAAFALKAQGAPFLSLGLAPLHGLEVGRGPLTERALALGGRLMRPWYDAAGLAFFKSKFDPRWEPRYCAVLRPWQGVGLGLALLRLHLRRQPFRGAAVAPIP